MILSFTSDNCMDYILTHIPGFQKSWEEHVLWWGEDQRGLGNDVAAFSRYIVNLLSSGQDVSWENVCGVIEVLLSRGDQEVRNAMATNCLENVINRVSDGGIDAKPFLARLGKESRKYCIAWDDFTGVRTPGLQE